MRAFAKNNIVTASKKYKKGEKLNLPENVLRILEKQGAAYVINDDDEELPDGVEDGSAEDDEEEIEILSEADLNKIAKKADLVAYAAKIGFEISESLKKDEIVTAIINFQEEHAEEV